MILSISVPIVTVTDLAGVGLSAKFVEQGGGDLILVYNSGRYRMAGRGSLAGMMPYGDANAIVLEMVCHPFSRLWGLSNSQKAVKTKR